MCFTVFVGVACVRLSISTAGTKVVYEADMHDLIEAENNNAKSLRSPTSSTAAVCFSGHVRTLIEMAPDIERYLLQAFPRYEAFFLLNLKDQYTSWRINRFANNTSYTVSLWISTEIFRKYKKPGFFDFFQILDILVAALVDLYTSLPGRKARRA